MIPEPEDHQSRSKPPSNYKLPALVIAVVLIAGAAWFMIKEKPDPIPRPAPEKIVAPTEPEPMPETVNEAPDIPDTIVEEPEAAEEEALILPSLKESDPFARDVLAPLNNSEEYALWLQTENIVPKAAAFVDGLTRGQVLRKVIPIKPPEGSFTVVREDDRILMDETNYQRYNTLTDIFTSIPPAMVSQVFQTLRPLFEEAYSELGHPADKADNSLIAAIDEILAAPEIDEPIALKSKSVSYTYADPALEALSPLKKQMLRMGPDNTARIKAYLKTVREELLQEIAEPAM